MIEKNVGKFLVVAGIGIALAVYMRRKRDAVAFTSARASDRAVLHSDLAYGASGAGATISDAVTQTGGQRMAPLTANVGVQSLAG